LPRANLYQFRKTPSGVSEDDPQNGTFIISYPPYGYANIDGEMRIVPEEAEVVKRIFAECLAGTGTYTIARNLNADHIPFSAAL